MKIRINNFGAEPPTYLCETPLHADQQLSIVKYSPNIKYGKLQEYLDEGWEDIGNSIKKDRCTIDKNCFTTVEAKYVVATLTYDTKEGCTDLRTVGQRVLELTKKDRETFFSVYEIAAKMLCEQDQS